MTAAEQPSNPQAKPPESNKPLDQQAHDLLTSGLEDDKSDRRADAVRALSLLQGDPEAPKLALKAMDDDKAEVRAAAAMSLGPLRAKSAIPKLKEALGDKDVSVVLAAANSLVTLKVVSAYDIYAQILTGEMKGHKSLVAGEMDTLKDKKKLAMMGLQQGVGFIPYGGLGYDAVRTILKDDGSPVRVAATKVLINDPSEAIDNILVDSAMNDKSEAVRVAALEAISKRGHPATIQKIAPAMNDDKDPVKLTAAAAILHLTEVAKHPKKKSLQNLDHAN